MYLGLDLGTSGLKGLLIDDNQNIVAEASAAISVSRPHDGWSEQDPADWIAATQSVFSELAKAADLSLLQAIGVSGHMHGATCLDKSGDVIRPAILWNDTRSYVEAAAMDADPEWRAVTGNIVFPGFTAPKINWMRKNEPSLFERIDKVLLPKDYLRYWLVGEFVAEMSDAAGTAWLDTGKRDWSDSVLAKTGLSRAQMPRLVEGSDISGTVRTALAQEFGFSNNVIVSGGAGDNAAAAIGVGVVKEGDAFASLGTSGVLFAACDGFKPDPETAVHTFCHALPDTWHQMGVILSATDSLNWYAKFVGKSAVDLTERLGELEAPGKTLFLPYLGGERTPHNDADVRGAFLGLEHITDQNAGTRAVLEGVVHAFRDSFDALTSTGTKMERIMAVGGGSKSDYWLKAMATALNMPIDVPVSGDFGGALGSARLAMMAKTGAGAEIAGRPPVAKTIEPINSMIEAFSDAHSRYREAYNAIRSRP